MKSSRRGRLGFTVMEMLVTLGIIFILISMILPAILSARQASKRTSCVNNLRQIILALSNYETCHRVLPSGVVDSSGPIQNGPDGLHVGWVVQLLPFMEQSYLSGVIDTRVSVYGPENTTAARTTIKTLLCPMDPEPPRPGIGRTSYAACHHDVEAPIDADNHGVFFLNSRVTFADITDGASNTFFVGEKSVDSADLGWMSGSRSTLRNTGSAINGLELSSGERGPLFVGGFGSRHPGGANFTFGDGSVRFLTQSIATPMLRRMGHRADGELIDEIGN